MNYDYGQSLQPRLKITHKILVLLFPHLGTEKGNLTGIMQNELTSCLNVDTSLAGAWCACNRVKIVLTSVVNIDSNDCTLFVRWSSFWLICSRWLLLITKLSECESTVECCKYTGFVVVSRGTCKKNIMNDFLYPVYFQPILLGLYFNIRYCWTKML